MAYREARPFLYILVLAAALAWIVTPWLSLPFLLAAGYVLYFFRDPERNTSKDPRDIVSPADGRVISVVDDEERWFSREKRVRVAIFLSVFDVHVNRAPVSGRIVKSIHEPGKFLDARDPAVDVENEHRTWLLETERGPVVVRQIAGLIARRIVAWAKIGEHVEKGDRIGMIRFGSRTDLYLPRGCQVLVKAGDRVAAGSSVVARWPEGGV
ncbi:MAG: phosphatidylserine decarboxylase family protein [Candidatus Methylacidiphilales bacterium]